MRLLNVCSWMVSLALGCLVRPAACQPSFRWLAVDGATATAVGVLWAHGFDDDDDARCGLAAVLAQCRLERARAATKRLLASGMQVGGDHALVFGVVPAGAPDQLAAFLGALLAADAPFADDQLALWIARAALAADDAEFLYPGTVLQSAARRAFGGGTPLGRPPAGSATAIARLTPAAVRAALSRPVPHGGAGLGAVTAAEIAAVAALPWPAAPLAPRGDAPVVAGRGASEPVKELHSRVDAPFVGAAFPVPPIGDRAAFALGVEVARSRAQRRFQSRGPEALARAPFVQWSWLAAEPLVVFCRRGEQPEALLPGQRQEADADAEAEATAAELRALLADLRERPPDAGELAAAVRALTAQLALPAPGVTPPWASEPATLPGRLITLLLAPYHRVDVDALAGIAPAEVAAALATALAPERASWHALLPEPRADRGFRAR